ncbi:TRIC cation channel family protein [Oribacterium sp. oral taxon 102]|uniref:trimeric intracellular cation channel family protein n=1 Tax=Oribacterium sp. oral taxon 102 TaxID=671214 RepID=UPI0015BAB131|nr:TRIC cation channel family protein [Oribacterium sp. oral taxon 102]NWO21218.1 TRIC cation channel family protein [Oribacterium sp. oral taxon 102]
MGNLQTISGIVEMAGIIAFSISGAMIAVEEEVDLFGILLLGLITAMGGGVMRDVLLGLFPSANFYNYPGIIASLASSAAVFIIAYTHRDYYFRHSGRIAAINNVVDSLGLGLFSVTGAHTAMQAAGGENIYLLVFMGMLTGVGGGLIRDTIAGRKPVILTRHIYAVASILGSFCYCLFVLYGLPGGEASVLGVTLVFAIRIYATKKCLNLPRVSRNS